MAKEPTPVQSGEKVEATATASAFPLTVDEFCTRLSATDRRVELIGAFHATEKAAGRAKDLESAFLARFESFVSQPA